MAKSKAANIVLIPLVLLGGLGAIIAIGFVAPWLVSSKSLEPEEDRK